MDYLYLLYDRLKHSFQLFLFSCLSILSWGQEAQLEESSQAIPTYMFSDPDPVPILAKRGDIYPYFRFDQYSNTQIQKEWKVVELENDFIKTAILPEVGGKVWGIIDKSSGMDFIYWNQVLKFRDVAMRGAWTSGGIEFNFGFIGHTPATATPVDYRTVENPDGSVSCFVGGLDLPSRTEWRVEIRLPADKAYLETRSFWYNPTSLHHPYYYWSNSAVHATQDLEFYYPGDHFIGHDGRLSEWPVDKEGRDLSKYDNNQFGSHKSYHILGHNENHQGVYWRDKQVGMGHWALQSDLPGQKLWLWSQSRNGAIWEDLLTDEDGQYVEVQAGRMFNQANLNSGHHSPFGQGAFYPYASDQWTELWFPLGNIGGLSAASPQAAIHLERHNGKIRLNVMALEKMAENLRVMHKGVRIQNEKVNIEAGEHRSIELAVEGIKNLTIQLGSLHFESPASPIARPLQSDPILPHGVSGMLHYGEQEFLFRNYVKASEWYQMVLEEDPMNVSARTRLAEIAYRRGQYQLGIDLVQPVLAFNTYEGGANFIFGTLLRAQGKEYAAQEAFALAVKDPRYQLAAEIQLASLFLARQDLLMAQEMAETALAHQAYSIPALSMLAISQRVQGKQNEASNTLVRVESVDPLSHLARFERWKGNPNEEAKQAFLNGFQNELPQESFLELALFYVQLDREQEALQILEMAPEHPMVSYWQYYLSGNADFLSEANTLSPAYVFPFRLESIPVLSQAARKSTSWLPHYYLGLLYWGIGRKEEAYQRFRTCGKLPEYAPFYLTRALLGKELGTDVSTIQSDLMQAYTLAPNSWRSYKHLGAYQFETGQYETATRTLAEGYKRFPQNFNLGLTYAGYLLHEGEWETCLEVLEAIEVLPFEGASAGHTLYEQAHVLSAAQLIGKGKDKQAFKHLEAARLWPENLGVGKPYQPDERILDYLIATMEGEESEIWEKLAKANNPSNSWQFVSIDALQRLGQGDQVQARIDQLSGEQAEWIKAYLNRSSETGMLMEQVADVEGQVPFSKSQLLIQVLKLAGLVE